MNVHITTPFGRRPLTAAHLQAQVAAAACSPETTVNKWAVFRHIAQAKDTLGVSDRTLAVLNALLSFHPETALVAGQGGDLVVFPSNEQLRLRAHGMAETTLRRHLGALVEAGLLIRRDSPNGKRYARKGQGGEITHAFGFDLTPIVSRACEFKQQAEIVEAERRELRLAREQVTILRRDAAKMITAGVEGGHGGDWTGLRARYASIVMAIPRTPSPTDLKAIRRSLAMLVADVGNVLIQRSKTLILDGSDSHPERHIQNSKTDTLDSEPASESRAEDAGEPRPAKARSPEQSYPLAMVLDACPDIRDYTRAGAEIRSWHDLVAASELVRTILGISPAVWLEAQATMGAETAAATVAAILQRAEHIKSPGGYLRTLVERKRAGRYSLGPVLMALNRARLAQCRNT
jgi:replication initiation protein RepC